MSHIPTLVSDLALILITAGIVTVVFKSLKQPVVLGYIVAGFLISPHFLLLPSIADSANISVWAEIGVIFLLFALGLEFSFKKLLSVGRTILIANAISMGAMMLIGYFIGTMLGWTHIESIFLGGMISMSSTMIIIKAFDDMGLKKHKFAGIVLGMLIVEDLVAILMMVLLSTFAVSSNFEGMDLAYNVLKLVFFVVIWFVIGIFIIPTLLKRFKRFLNDETLLIVSVGLCLGMVLFASSVGFSTALGAFIMGSILSETVESKQIEHLIEPLKNLFGAVFFVSVGMMIVPSILVEYYIPILIITGVILVCVTLFSTLGLLAAGESLKVSVQAGFSLAQIGEFSFILATLGMQLGVISDFMYPIIVSVSVITTFTTPFFMKASNPVYNLLVKKIPPNWTKLIDGYSKASTKKINDDTAWKKLIKSILSSIAIYTSLTLAILILSRQFLFAFITSRIDGAWGLTIYATITILLMSPFINAIMRSGSFSGQEVKSFWTRGTININKVIFLLISILRTAISPIIIAFVLAPIFPNALALLIVISILVSMVIVLFQGFRNQTVKMEKRFLDNLNDKDNSNKKTITTELEKDLERRSIHIERIIVPQDSAQVGKSLSELNFRKSTGVSIVSIIRGKQIINIPDRNTRIYPLDKIVVVGSDEGIQSFIVLISKVGEIIDNLDDILNYRIEIKYYEVEPNSPFINKGIKEIDIQNKTECLITGIERDGEMIVNFNSDFIFKENDILWIAGEKKKLALFEANVLNSSTQTFAY
jgi:CPA2 family monovalent cation:H+ antiporter-2